MTQEKGDPSGRPYSFVVPIDNVPLRSFVHYIGILQRMNVVGPDVFVAPLVR